MTSNRVPNGNVHIETVSASCSDIVVARDQQFELVHTQHRISKDNDLAVQFRCVSQFEDPRNSNLAVVFWQMKWVWERQLSLDLTSHATSSSSCRDSCCDVGLYNSDGCSRFGTYDDDDIDWH